MSHRFGNMRILMLVFSPNNASEGHSMHFSAFSAFKKLLIKFAPYPK